MKKTKYLLLSTLIFSSLSLTQVTSANNTEEIKFNSCSEAWAAGYANIERGEIGYSSKLDRDNDGKACELKYDKKGEYKREGQPLNKIKATQPEVETTTPEKPTENDTKPELIGTSEPPVFDNNSQPTETEPKTEESKPTEESSENNPNSTETSDNNLKPVEPTKTEEVKENKDSKTQTSKDETKVEETKKPENDKETNHTKNPDTSNQGTTPELNTNTDNNRGESSNNSTTPKPILGVELTSEPTEKTTIKEENDHNQKATTTVKPAPKKIAPKKETHDIQTKKALPKTSAVK